MNFKDLLQSEFLPFSTLSPSQLEQLEAHYQLLLRWNQRLNLTRITNLEDAVRFHYCESLFVGLHLPPGPYTVADFGSGAGFPGLPVSILRPDLSVTLVESDARKCVFLREASRGKENVAVLQSRFEDLTQTFQWVIGRAVTPKQILESPLSHKFALLVSTSGIEAGSEVVRLPWGKDRVLTVSRETSD